MAYHPFRNLGLKLMAVLLATAMWFTVAGERAVERTMRIPLELVNKPADIEILGDPPTSVDIRVLGSSALLSRVQTGEVVAMLDLESARPGSRLFHIRTEAIRVPYGVKVLQITPATIAVELERSVRRRVRVVPAIEGEPAPGFVAGEVQTRPDSVEVVGPESHVSALRAATTEPIILSGQRATVQDTVTVGVPDSAVRLVEPTSANVSIQVVPAPVERVLKDVPIRWRNLNTGLSARLQPLTTDVKVRGRRDALDSMHAEAVAPFVDLAGLGPGQYNLRVQFDPTESFGVSATEPAVVQVSIK